VDCYCFSYFLGIVMKFCGCKRCRENGEVNPYEQFEIYLAQQEDEKQKEFQSTLGKIFSVQELSDMETKFNPPTAISLATRINFWYGLGGNI